MSLNESYKISVAKDLTQLAIQNGLISRYEDEAETAKAVCSFFNSIIENLDASEK